MESQPAPALEGLPPAPVPPALRILSALQSRLDVVAEAIVAAVWRDVPVYGAQTDPRVRAAVLATVEIGLDLGLRRLARGGTVVAEEFTAVVWPRPPREFRLRTAEVLHAHEVALGVICAAAIEAAQSDGDVGDALGVLLATISQAAFAAAGAHVAALFDDDEADGEAAALARALLERLLTGELPSAHAQRALAKRCGLETTAPCMVVVAGADGLAARRTLAAELRRIVPLPFSPLTVVRPDEVVLVVPITHPDVLGPAVRRLCELRDRQRARGIGLSIGVSTVRDGLAETAAAYREACRARERAGCGGVVAFCEMTPLEYLTQDDDDTAGRLVRAPIRAFFATDRQRGGVLVATLDEYVAADLNATLTAERLHMHVNTVRYRLARIEEQTGCDLRRLEDVLELLVAARVFGR